MNRLRPFFLLIQRPMVLFGVIGWMIIASYLLGILVRPGGAPDLDLDAAYLTVVILSVYSGWIAGACVLELQQSSFAFVLPRASARLIPGFLLLGSLAVVFAVALTVSASPYPQSPGMLLLIGLGAYGLGGAIRDPQSGAMTGLGLALFLVLVIASATLGRLAAERPAWVAVAAAAVLFAGLYRLFSRAAFRSRPVGIRRTVLAFSLEKLARTDRNRVVSQGRRTLRWNTGYLGHETGRWLRAAWHETWGGLVWRSVPGFLARSWGLILLFVLAAWETMDQNGFWRALNWSLHDAIMRSPHAPEYGEKGGPFLLIAIFIAMLGASMAVFRPVMLHGGMRYPLSRRDLGRVAFAGSLADLALFLLLIAPAFYLVGLLTGWAAGFEARFDYMPYYLRVLLITLILMPFAYHLGLRFQLSTWRREVTSLVGVGLAQAAYVLAVVVLAYVAGRVFRSALIELSFMLSGLVVSRLLHRARLRARFETADLV